MYITLKIKSYPTFTKKEEGDRRKKVTLGRGGVEGGDLKGSNTDALKMK